MRFECALYDLSAQVFNSQLGDACPALDLRARSCMSRRMLNDSCQGQSALVRGWRQRTALLHNVADRHLALVFRVEQLPEF